MTQYGVDYSVSRPSLTTLGKYGKSFVCRYLAYLPNDKVITANELAKLHGGGIGVVLNWEQANGDMLRGYNIGQIHAREALKQANALGAPATVPIYFSCDVAVNGTSEMNAVAAYLDGVASVMPRARIGVYGDFRVIEALVPQHATWGWQTYGWSGGMVSGKAHLYQYSNGQNLDGNSVDLDRSLKDNFGAWFPKTEARVMLNMGAYALPLLSQGMSDQPNEYHHIARAQIMLNYLGEKLAVDGQYGPATANAIKVHFGGNGNVINENIWAGLFGMSHA